MADESPALVVALEARIAQFEQQMNKAVRGAYGAASKIEKAFLASNDNIAKRALSRSGFSSAIGQGLDEVKGRAMDAASSMPVLGGALAALGPAGIAAGVAIAGVAVALNQARQAAQFADDLSAVANKLSLTAESWQELIYAAEANDIEIPKAEQAISDLNAALGALQSGVGDAKIRKALEALGIPQSQIDSLRTAEDLLPILADHINQLGTEAEQVQLARKFGVGDLLPLLRQGSAGIAELRLKARDLGLVLDEETVQSTANLNEELRVADARLQTASRRLGTEFVPALVGVKTALADAASGLAGFFKWIGDFDSDGRKVQQKIGQISSAYERASKARSGYWGAVQAGASGLEALNPAARERIAKQAEVDAARLQEELKAIVARQNQGWEDTFNPKDKPKPKPSGGGGDSGKPTAATTDTDTYEALYAKIAGDSYKLFVEQFKKQVLATGEGNADGASKSLRGPNDLVPSEEAVRDALAPLEEARNLLARQIEGGLRAGFEGGLPGVLNYFASAFKAKLASTLADMLANNIMGTSGGGLSKLAKFAGFFAGGGDIPAGQWGIAGEKGAELVRGPATVLSNSNTIKALTASAARPVVMPSASPFARSEVKLTINLEGANGDETIRRIAYDAAAQGFAAARVAARSDLTRKTRNVIP